MIIYKKIINYLLLVIVFPVYSDIVSLDGCKTKLIQVMKPEWPRTNYQGYSIVEFKINENGKISNSRVDKSMCAISRNSDGIIEFKACPYFKGVSIAASKYLKYKPPLDESKSPCVINKHKYKYNFSLYNIKIVDNNFVLREEYESNKEFYINRYNNMRMEINNPQDYSEPTSLKNPSDNIKN